MDSTENKDLVSKGIFFDSSIIIALITGISYAATYIYQYSFLHYYGVPSYFIDIRLSQVLFTALIVTSLIGIFFIVTISAINDIKDKNKPTFKNEFGFFLKFFLLIFTGTTITTYVTIHRVIFSLILSFIFTSLYVLILRKAISKNKNSENQPSFLSPFLKILGGYKVLLLILAVTFSLFIASGAGKSIAGTKSEYLIVNTSPETAVIETYSDGFITIGINKEKKVFNENINFISNSQISSEKLFFSREHVGPLRNGGVYISNDFILEYLITHFKFLKFKIKF